MENERKKKKEKKDRIKRHDEFCIFNNTRITIEARVATVSHDE